MRRAPGTPPRIPAGPPNAGPGPGALSARGEGARAEHPRLHPGESAERRPVHTVYVPADRFTADTPGELGAEALRLLDAHAPDDAAVASAFGVDAALAGAVRE